MARTVNPKAAAGAAAGAAAAGAAAGAAAAGAAVAGGKLAHDRFARSKPSRAYRFKDDEAVPDAIRRIALGRIDHALEELRGKADSTPEEAVHEARKDMKKLRGLIRLVRGELGEKAYRRENAAFRDAGQLLSGVRDADVMVATIDQLAERFPKELPPDASGGLRQALEAQEPDDDRSQAARQAVEMLEQAWDRVDDWPLEEDSFDALEGGLEQVYARGRKAFRAAKNDPTAERLHEWRKRSKDLWYHHQLLQSSWPEAIDPLSDQAHDLADHLGDDHDLAVLAEWAKEHAGAAGGLYALQELNDVIELRRAELQAQAFALGERLYAERPGAFRRRFRGYWRSSRTARSAQAQPRPA
jgi:CHAD domain-containing protein